MMRIGHRGARGHAPENTLAAIEAGIAAGVDFVELDVQRTRDGYFVIMHDKRVDRTTNGTGYVTQMTLQELRRLDCGSGERIPTLDEVLEVARGRAGLMLEIITPGIGHELSSFVAHSGFQEPLIYASFLHGELLAVEHGIKLALIEGVPVNPTVFASEANASHVGLSIDSITSGFIDILHRDKFAVFVYTVNDPRDIDWLGSLGVEGVISDYPALVPKL